MSVCNSTQPKDEKLYTISEEDAKQLMSYLEAQDITLGIIAIKTNIFKNELRQKIDNCAATKDEWRRICKAIGIKVNVLDNRDKYLRCSLLFPSTCTPLKDVLKICKGRSKDFKNRIEQEYYVNPMLAIMMAEEAKTVQDCNAMLNINFKRGGTKGSSSIADFDY